MNVFRRFVRWLGFGNTQQSTPTYTGDDKARRAMYPELTDEEYRARVLKLVNKKGNVEPK